ncbi:MAG: NADH-quinone oxidoreductase subunit N [Bacteroidetes bacterium]|nr:NADH-quinone oxidoreductase subunit N [Bacteroidota bacterium]
MYLIYIICGLGIVSLLAEIFNFKKALLPIIMLGLLAAIGVAAVGENTGLAFSGMVLFDRFSVVYSTMIVAIAFCWFWMAYSYFHNRPYLTDQSALVLFSIVGAVILTAFANMAMLFLGIEILSIALYALSGSKKNNLFSTESSFKYFLMGSFATGFLLMGIALVYGATGSFELMSIQTASTNGAQPLPSFFYVGVLLILVGISFKVSVVPFHFWAPDVYEGAPTPITAFMSTIVKMAAFAALIRLFTVCFAATSITWLVVFYVMCVLTLLVSSVSAVYQSNVKRMLAYSSVGHAGYILIAIVSGGNVGGLVSYYLAGYAVASLIAFAVIHQIEESGRTVFLSDFQGLFRKSPWLAVSMTIALLSLAGIPPLAGFFGKYLLLTQAIGNGHLALALVAIFTSLIGVYYYFKVIIAMYSAVGSDQNIMISTSQKALLFILVTLVVVLGVFPDWFTFL